MHEEAVAGGEQQPDTEAFRRKPITLQVLDRDGGLRVFGPQILAKLVAQVGGRVALGEDRRRRLAVNRAVIGREQHRHVAALGLLERGQHG